MSQAISFAGFPEGVHRSYLVSNGYFEEEVHRAVEDLNKAPYVSKVSLISRGQLLKWSEDLGAALWPSELADTRVLLELFLADVNDLLPVPKLADLLQKVLLLDLELGQIESKAEFARRVTSAALLTGVATGGFAEAGNHLAVASAWTLFAVSLVGASEKHAMQVEEAVLQTLELAEVAICDALADLLDEVRARPYLVEGNAFADPEVWSWRYTTVLGALSCLAIADDSRHFLSEDEREFLGDWLARKHDGIDVWSEAAIANLVPWLTWSRKHVPTIKPDFEIAALCELVVARNQPRSKAPLPTPYYSFEEVARSRMGLQTEGALEGPGGETFAGSSFTAELLLHLLVRTNLKQKCKSLWADFTRLSHRSYVPDHGWQYCRFRSREGAEQTKHYRFTYEWKELKEEARAAPQGEIPRELAHRSWLLAMWWQVAPHRCSTNASHALIDAVIPRWGT
jgi:hypothetical protein